jgi:hypothetical protein
MNWDKIFEKFWETLASTGTKVVDFIGYSFDKMKENPTLILILIAVYIAKDMKIRVGNILDWKV